MTLGGSSGNTYSGATTISSGTVSLAKTSGYAVPGNLTISGGSTYVVVQNANPQFSPGAIVTFSSSPHLEVFGNNVTVGGISGAGIVENTEAETTVSSNGTLTVNSAAGSSSSYSGYLRDNAGGSGTLALVKNGAGSLTLSGSNVGAYSGGLTVNAGLLSYTGTAPNCNYTLNGGTLNVSGNRSMKVLQMTGGSLTGGTITGSSAYDLEAGTVSIALGGTVGFNKTTAGTVSFSKAPPNGPYAISAGTLDLGTQTKTMASGSLTLSGGTLSGSGTLTAASGYNYNIQSGTINMILGGGSSIGLLKSGVGTAIITATEKYGGTTTVNGGILQVGVGGTAGVAGTGSITINSAGTFDVNHSDAVSFSGKIGGSGTLAKDGGGTLTMSGSNSFAGNLVVNAGLLSYGGNTGSFPGGNFSVNGGTLDFGSLSKTMGSAGVLTLAGGTLSGSGTLTGSSAYQLQAGTVNIALGGSVGLNKTGAGTVSLLKNLPGGNYAISAGTLNLGGFSQSISGLQISGGTLSGSGTLTSSSDYNVQAGTVDVVLGGSSVGIHKTGAGTAILTRANTFGGSTTISGGALDADFGATIPASGFLTLDGGMLETLVGGTFTRSLGGGGSNSFQMTAGGGGFSTAGGPCTLNIGGSGGQVTWGSNVGSQLVGTLRLCSPTCTNSVTFLNAINLGGGARTLEVDDNPNSLSDYAVLSGAISDSIGGGSLSKTGGGTLYLQGSASNTYAGATTIMGTVYAAKSGGGVAIPGNVVFSETGDGTNTILQLGGDNEIGASAALTFTTSVGYARLELDGHAQTVASISGNNRATIEGLYDNTGLNNDSTLTVNNAADCTYAGVIRDSTQGSGTGKLNLVKGGGGELLLSGVNLYSGATTVNGGTLEIDGSIQASCGASIASGGTLYFNQPAGYQGCGGSITGSGTLRISQGAHSLQMGAGGNTTLCGFGGMVSFTSGGVYLRSVDGLGSGSASFSNGAVCDLNTSATTTFSNPITLAGIGGMVDGYAKPAIYGDGSGGASTYTLSGQITLAASSDVGNYYGNGMLTFSGKITGPGGLVLGKSAPTLADEYGAIALAGATSNDYSGGTTINRGKVYLQKTGGAIAIPGDLTLTTALTLNTGNTYLILNGSEQIASSATLTFLPLRGFSACFELLGNNQTVAGIGDITGTGMIENAEQETGIANLGTLTINNSSDCSYSGYIRNGDLAANGASTGLLALVKGGPGTLTLTGSHCGNYTGGLTVNAGTLDYSGAAVLPGTPLAYPSGPTGPTSPAAMTPCPYTINGGTLKIGGLSASIGAFQIGGGTVTGTGTLTSNAAYDVRGGRVDANLAGSGIGLTKSGATLAVLTGANSYTGRTTVSGGTLQLGPAAQAAVLNVGGADIQSGMMVFDYAGSSDPMATIEGLLTASYDGGHWDVGQFRDSTALATGLTLGLLDDTSLQQVKVMATYPGDFNLDGVVDNQDKAIWFANAFSGTTWQQGDANHDGVVDGRDRDLLFASVGLPQITGILPAASGLSSVPEPGTLSLLAAALLGLLAYGWRKRK